MTTTAPLQIAFRFGDRRWFASLVCALRGGDSAHCEMSVLRDRLTREVEHHCISASFLDDGVRFKTMPLPVEKWRIYEMPQDSTSAIEWLREHDGDKYDWLGLLGFMARWIRGRSNRRFCSEAAAEVLGLPDPFRYDLALLESVCSRFGRRVQ